MTYYITNAIVGIEAEKPDPANPSGGAELPNYPLFLAVDTGKLYHSTGTTWEQVNTLGLPGVTGDGLNPNGVSIAGSLYAGGATPDPNFPILINDGQGNEILGYNLSNQQLYSPAIFTNSATVYNGLGEAILEVQGTTGTTSITDVSSVFHGTVKATSGISAFNAPVLTSQPVLATGAGATVDDVITLLQSYGLCKQA